MLFPIYINYVVNAISCNIKLLTDDTSLNLAVYNGYEALPISLIKISKVFTSCPKESKIKCNPDKTEIMTISKKTSSTSPPPIYMENIIIIEVEPTSIYD